MNELTLKLYNRHRSVLVRVEFHEGETAVRLHSDLDDVAVTLEDVDSISFANETLAHLATYLEKRNEVGLAGVGDKISDVDSRVESWSLSDNDIVTDRSTLEVDGSGSVSGATHSRDAAHAASTSASHTASPRGTRSSLRLLLVESGYCRMASEKCKKECKMEKESVISCVPDSTTESVSKRTWFAQLTRIAREPSHSPFIVAMACSASVLSRKAKKP